jgi:hypothetical protein
MEAPMVEPPQTEAPAPVNPNVETEKAADAAIIASLPAETPTAVVQAVEEVKTEVVAPPV